METVVFDGRQWAAQRTEEYKKRVEILKQKGIVPKLVWVQMGNHPANELYGRLKGKKAEELGVVFEKLAWGADWRFDEVKAKLEQLNHQPEVHGIMIQLPITRNGQGVSEQKRTEILSLIDPTKDVDCLTPNNLGLVMAGVPRFLPATVQAVMEGLQIALEGVIYGKRVVVVGGGLEVGRPLANHLSNLGATVLWARSSARQNLGKYTLWGEIVISAVGKPGLISGDMVQSGVMAIDVGSPQGDFDFASVKPKAAFITPVPGGVGPVTVMALMNNVIKAAEQKAFA